MIHVHRSEAANLAREIGRAAALRRDCFIAGLLVITAI